MKKAILILAAVALTCATALGAAPKKTINVDNATDFINALGSDRTIVVTDYIELTPALREMSNKLYKRPGNTPQIYVNENFDGPGLVLSHLTNLSIVSGDDVVTIVVEPRYVNVFTFIGCSDIELKGLTLGHTEEGYCDEGVLGFTDCTNVSVKECDLFGCGTEGIALSNVKNFAMTGSKIRDCSYHIMHVSESTNIVFDGCQFFRNREFTLCNISSSDTVLFNNCIFANNEGILFYLSCPVKFRNSVVLHNPYMIFDEEGNSEYFLEYENSIVEDFFHEEMTIEAVYG